MDVVPGECVPRLMLQLVVLLLLQIRNCGEVDKPNMSKWGVLATILRFWAAVGHLGRCFPTAHTAVLKLERSERDQPILPFPPPQQ